MRIPPRTSPEHVALNIQLLSPVSGFTRAFLPQSCSEALIYFASLLISFARFSRASNVWGRLPAFSIDLKTA